MSTNARGKSERMSKSMRPKTESGWMGASKRRGAPPKIEPVVPAKFDSLIRKLGIKPEAAPKHPVALKWIKKYYRSRYVPEKILDAAGIPEHFRAF